VRFSTRFAAASSVLALAAVLAPRQVLLSRRPADRGLVRGVLHVHGSRSADARGTVAEVARAARAAGLDFVVLADHDADDAVPAPTYADGVLVLTGMERSTDGGHALVLGASPLPFRLDGEPAAVVADAEALGAFVLASHPAALRPESAWTAGCVGLAGREVVSFGDAASWPLGPRALLAALRYPLDPRGALLQALRPSARARAGWDACLAQGPAAGWLGSDAHGGLRLGPLFLPVPSYRAVFGLGGNHLTLAEPATGDAAHDAALVWQSLRGGRGFAALDGLADATGFAFAATAGARTAGPGQTLEVAAGEVVRVTATAPAASTLVLLRDGGPVARARTIDETLDDAATGVYRVEAFLDGDAEGRPWIVSNAIGVFRADEARARAARLAVPPEPVRAADAPERFAAPALDARWQVDRAADAAAAVRPEDGALRFDFALGPGARTYASVCDWAPRDLSPASGVAFRARASARFRADVQVRTGGPEGHVIWRRSVLLDPGWRDVYVPFAALRTWDPAGARPDLARVVGVYVEVEALHLAPGTRGTIWLDDWGTAP
jgi:hypothetical protein